MRLVAVGTLVLLSTPSFALQPEPVSEAPPSPPAGPTEIVAPPLSPPGATAPVAPLAPAPTPAPATPTSGAASLGLAPNSEMMPMTTPVAPTTPTPTMGAMPPSDSGTRTLLNHTFPQPTLLDTAFVTTQFGVGTELGVFLQPGLQVNGGTYDRNLTFIKESFSTDIAPMEYFNIGLDADYLALVGVGGDAFLRDGGATAFEFRPGARVHLFREKSWGTQLGLHAYGIIGGGIRLAPGGLIGKIGEDLSDPTDPDFQKRVTCLANEDLGCAFPDLDPITLMKSDRSEAGGALSVNWAQALTRVIGGQFTVGASMTSESETGPGYERSSTPLAVFGGLGGSLNLDPDVPIGGTVEYKFTYRNQSYDYAAQPAGAYLAADSNSSMSHGVAAGLYYTGRRDLQLGWLVAGDFISGSEEFTQVDADGKETSGSADAAPITNVTARFTLRYFW